MLRKMNRGSVRSRETILVFGLAILITGVFIGCQEHRISQTDFEEIQVQTNLLPTTQPAANVPISNQLIEESLGQFKIGPADVLTITVSSSDQTGGPPPATMVRVNRAGQVELPLAGKIKVAGMELEDAEAAIQQAYVPKIFRQAVVHVEVTHPDTASVLVTGAVTAPGLVPLSRNQRNVLYAIVGAGGVTEQTSKKVVLRRIRSPQCGISFDLSCPEGIRQALAQAPLQTGDVVEVQAAVPNMIYVGGLVRDSRPQVYPPGTPVTILQALAGAGGLRTDLTPREGTLIRRLPNGQEVQVKLNLDRITTGKDPNLVLAAGDILWVPYTVETRVQEWINQNIYFKAGMTVNYVETGEHNYLHGERWNNQNTGTNGATLQDTYDPFGFLNNTNTLNTIANQTQNAKRR